MKISEYIQKLEELKAAEGDVEVHTQGFHSVTVARAPQVVHLRLLSKRESVVRTWHPNLDAEEKKGQKVAYI